MNRIIDIFASFKHPKLSSIYILV